MELKKAEQILDTFLKVGKGSMRMEHKPQPHEVDMAIRIVLYNLSKYKTHNRLLESMCEEMNMTILENTEDNGEISLNYKLRLVRIKNEVWNK